MTLHPAIQRFLSSLKAKNRPLDETSRQLWRELAAVEKVFACCGRVRTLQAHGLTTMWAIVNGRRYRIAEINYCPQCGRPLS